MLRVSSGVQEGYHLFLPCAADLGFLSHHAAPCYMLISLLHVVHSVWISLNSTLRPGPSCIRTVLSHTARGAACRNLPSDRMLRALSGMVGLSPGPELGRVLHNIVQTLSGTQKRLGVYGAVGEIGIHHGWFFTMLASEARECEQLFACDIFTDQGRNVDKSGKGNKYIFLQNVLTGCRS